MRLVITALWILLGSAISAALYWQFLITPESTVLALITSGLLAIIVLMLIALTITGAIAIWANGLSRSALTRAARSMPSILPAAVIVLLVWWMTLRVETWVGMYSGQISAWFIATLGWSDISWLFRAIRYTAMWLRWIIASMLALSLMAGFVAVGARAMTQAAWLRRALRPRSLVLCTLLFIVLIALPWKYIVPWRPHTLPATAIELAFITLKLSTAAVMAAVAVALIIREASGETPPPRDPREAAQAA
jgi:hypothetical protein